MHIDTVLARGGQGQDTGRLGRKFVADEDDPVPPDGALLAPWVALAYDGTAAAADEADRVLDEVQLATLEPQGAPTDPTTSTTGSTGSSPGSPGSGRCPGPGATTAPAGGRSWCPGC